MTPDVAERLLTHFSEGLAHEAGAGCAPWSGGAGPPDAVAFPKTTGEATDVLALAGAEGWSVGAAGAGSRMGAGLWREPPRLVVSAREMAGVRHYEPADLVITVGAGTPLSALREAAAAENQFLAVDPFISDSSTVGALAALAPDSALAPLYGRVRDLVLGATLVTGDGRILRLGGRVVKNVAGFDLLRLAVGSGGRLGLFTEISVRLHGVPPVDRVWLYGGTRTELTARARALATAAEVPAALELVGPGRGGAAVGAADGWTLALRMHGNAAGVRATESVFAAAAGRPDRVHDGGEAADVFARLATSAADSALSVRMSAPPARLDRLLDAVGDLSGALRPGVVALHATEGEARLELDAEVVERAASDNWATVSRVRSRLEAEGGSLWLAAAPPRVLETIAPRSDRPSAATIQRRLLERFDPNRVFRGAHGVD